MVFSSRIKSRPSRLFLMDTERNRVRQIDTPFGGDARTSEGVGRYNIAFAAPNPDMTPDGRFIVFTSAFSNLVRGDRNRAPDVFVYDRTERTLRIVSRSSTAVQANGSSYDPAISADGRVVVFDSRATNLSAEDTDRKSDVYVKDLRTGTTDLVSVGTLGKGDAASFSADVSHDGDRVSFVSSASNLVAEDANGTTDVFVRERSSSTTIRASVSSDGEEFETFELCESATCVRPGANEARISGSGELVVFTADGNALVPEDDNYNADIFVHEIDTGVTERVSVRSDGREVFGADDIECGKDAICRSDIGNHTPSVSRDGRLVYFSSGASQISDLDDDESTNESELYVHDRSTGSTVLVSRHRDGSVLNSTNWYPGMISSDGRWITYSCNSIKLDGPRGDQDPGPDVFLQRLPRALE